MYRLVVVLLAAIDAVVAAAVGLAALMAPLTLLWAIGFGASADWAALWPTAATLWQLGHFVPVDITLPAAYLLDTGIDPTLASFTLSLAPLAFALFTAGFAVRSGRRASQAEAWITGVLTGAVVFAGLAALVALTGQAPLGEVEQWQAILFPSIVFASATILGAVVTEWQEAGEGAIAGLRDRIESLDRGWGQVPALIARGGAVAITAIVGAAALLTAVAIIGRGSEIIALYERANVDAFGATLLTLGQLAYLPTLIVWAMSYIAGPGFALGTGTTVSPAGTDVGVVPGIPLLGAIPESLTPWMLLLGLIPVAAGAFGGWIARSRLAAFELARADARRARRQADVAGAAALAGLRGDDGVTIVEPPVDDGHDPAGARAVIALGISVLAGCAAALLAFAGSGALGPGLLAEVGPSAGPVTLAVGLEVAVGAGILLLAPRPRLRRRSAEVVADVPASEAPPRTATEARLD